MAQHDYTISNATFPAVRTDLNNALSAIQTTNSGTSRPTGAVAGQLWLDTTSATTPTLKYYDGADDISLATIDHVGNTVNWLDSTVSITGLSTTATGTVLTLSDSASTSTVNLIIDNQKEIRFRETTANGTNYVALKAPASLSADLTFTLPSTDGTSGQVIQTNGSGVLSFVTVTADGTADWDTTVKTSDFTATSNKGYFVNTTSASVTVTLPSTPSAGDEVIILDYAGTADTNNITVNPNGNKIEGQTSNLLITGDREGLRLVYIDSTQGWIGVSGFQEGTDALIPNTYSIEFLVVAGGGGAAGGGGGAGGFRTSTQTVTAGTVITVTVGDGGTGADADSGTPTNGSDSSISGSGLTTITSAGGGKGGVAGGGGANAGNGGSGGGQGQDKGTAGGTGNTPSTSPSQGNNGGVGFSSPLAGGGAGGGGGAGEAGNTDGSPTASPDGEGGDGGDGTASSITGSSVTYAGGGGGGANTFGNTVPVGAGGTGGGGDGTGTNNGTGTAGTANTGGGGGGGEYEGTGANGGKGVVILSMLTSKYSSTSTGSPTVTTSGSNTILQFNGSGSYTA
jgi:hypothetical protein